MYSELSQIFYPYNKFDTKEKLNELNHFTYRELPMIQAPIIPSTSISTTIVPLPRESYFYPKKKNSLFWCIYIFIHGYDEYQMIHHTKQSTAELSENQKIIDCIRSSPQILKSTNHKMTNIKSQEVLSDLMIGKTSNISLLLAYAVYYKISIIVCFEKKSICFEVIPEMSEKQLIIYYKDKNYGMAMNEETIDRETNVFIENYNKPLKAISHYKLDDLHKMAIKLEVKLQPKMKKNEVYCALENYFKATLLNDWQKN